MWPRLSLCVWMVLVCARPYCKGRDFLVILALTLAEVHVLGVQGRVATLQSLSGTGSLRVGAEFVSKFLPGRTVYLSNPTWCAHQPSHPPCFKVLTLGMQGIYDCLAAVARPRVIIALACKRCVSSDQVMEL